MRSNLQNRMVKLVLLFNSSADCSQNIRTTDLDSMKSSEKQSFGILENYHAVSYAPPQHTRLHMHTQAHIPVHE